MEKDYTLEEKTEFLTQEVLKQQDENGCWNVLKPGDKYYPDFQYYCPNYKSTLWTMILLADIKCRSGYDKLEKPFSIMAEKFFDSGSRIYTIGKSHFPIPCLKGNMLYLHSYFGFGDGSIVNGIIDFFAEYQRFDDGDFKTPAAYPYFSNRSCYGTHTCYWGIVKLLKGLSFLPESVRSENAKKLLKKCIDFVLLHEVCFSSHSKSRFLQPYIGKLGFPNMYRSDYLEILWLLKREGVKDPGIEKSLELLKSRRNAAGLWDAERKQNNITAPAGNRKYAGAYITSRAIEVLDFYS